MTERGGKTDSAPATPDPAAENGDENELVQFGSWEFVDRIPGREEVLELLQTLPPRWGVKVADYLEYLTPLPQSKKTKVRVGKNLVEQSVPVYVLYVSVAGREAMLQAAEELNRWRVSLVPEPVTPTGVPGWLQNDERRLVYREYCEIHEPVPARPPQRPRPAVDDAVDRVEYQLKGRKPGTAWVPQTGGKQAAGSNPVEKVETAARGRALAAWGFGVLPGSGVASLDEIQQAAENMLAQQQRHQEGQQEQVSSSGRPTREKLLEVTMQTMEEARMLRSESEYTADQRIIDHCQRRYGVNVAKPDADPELPPTVEWTRLNDGQLQLLTRAVQRSITEIRAQEQEV